MSTTVLQARDIEKYFVIDRPLYKQIISPFAPKNLLYALKSVNFHVESGQILAVVGPNGAGKTTLLRILANLLEPDAGRVTLAGLPYNSKPYIRSEIGYVSSDERSFFWRLTGRQNLEFFGRLYGINKPLARKRIKAILKLFGLENKASQLFRDYSTGTRKKFALARALLHRPKVLLLDEVTNSLDAGSARNTKSLVRSYVSDQPGRAGIWSTHRFEEIGEICDKLLIINEGRVTFFGDTDKPEHSIKDDKQNPQNRIINIETTRSTDTVFTDNKL